MAEGWGSFLGRLSSWLNPIFDPKKRYQREKDALLKEQDSLLAQPTSPDNSRRLGAILSRLRELDGLLQQGN